MSVLIIRFRKMGDTLMVTPIVGSLGLIGEDRVYCVAEQRWARLLTDLPQVRGLSPVSSGEPSRFELALAGLRARRFRCETALVLRFSNRAAMVAKLAGCKVRVGASETTTQPLSLDD